MLDSTCHGTCGEKEIVKFLANRPEFINSVDGWMRMTKVGILICTLWMMTTEFPEIYRTFRTQCEHCQPNFNVIVSRQNLRGFTAVLNVILCTVMLAFPANFLLMIPNMYVTTWIGVNVLSTLVGVVCWLRYDSKKVESLCNISLNTMLHLISAFCMFEFYNAAEYKSLIE